MSLLVPTNPSQLRFCPRISAALWILFVLGGCQGVAGGQDGLVCRTRADCVSGAVCDQGKCVILCTTDANCPSGQICERSRCTPAKPGTPPTTTPVTQCVQDGGCVSPGDCQVAEGAKCVSGECAYEARDCSTVPEPDCVDATTLRTYSAGGCRDNACQWVEHDSECTLDDGACGETCEQGCKELACEDANMLQGGCSQGVCVIDAEGAPACHYESARQAGDPCGDAGVPPCMEGACDAAGQCVSVPTAAGEPCDEGEGVCNGEGACVQCVADSDCAAGEKKYCQEDSGQCVACTQAEHCDDGLFCNGAEACDTEYGFVCTAGERCLGSCNEVEESCTPCSPGQRCEGDDLACTEHACDDVGACELVEDNCKALGEACQHDTECRGKLCMNEICCEPGVVCCTKAAQCPDGYSCSDVAKACQTSCTPAGGQCQDAYYCLDHECTAKKAAGQACTIGYECLAQCDSATGICCDGDNCCRNNDQDCPGLATCGPEFTCRVACSAPNHCKPEAWCDPSGSCQLDKEVTEGCVDHDECVSDHCDKNTQTCCAEGVECCHDNVHCDGNYACNQETGTCFTECQPGAVGGTCKPGITCGSGICNEGGAVGDSCDDPESCSSRHCLNYVCCAPGEICCQSDSADGVCGAYACNRETSACFGACSPGGDECSPEAFCNQDRTCQMKGGTGEPCAGPEACVSGNCNGVCVFTIYVDADAQGRADGTCWQDAFVSLRLALESVVHAPTEIWVAEGTYVPGPTRGQSFELRSSVAVLGGFSGTELRREERDLEAHPTRLSGDVRNDDAQDDPLTRADNSYHVVVVSNANESVVLDGLIIANGNADGDEHDGLGGGLWHTGGSLTVTNCRFENNRASAGGAVHTSSDLLRLAQVEMTANSAGTGGAVFAQDDLVVYNGTFRDNVATAQGGAVQASGGTFTCDHCVFERNRSEDPEAGGGAVAVTENATANLRYSTFESNQAAVRGGAIHNPGGTVVLVMSELRGNEAGERGGAASTVGGTLTAVGCKFLENRSRYHGGAVRGGDSYWDPVTHISLIGSVFYDNESEWLGGGAVGVFRTELTMAYSTVAGNRGRGSGAGVAAYGGAGFSVDITSSILWGNTNTDDQTTGQLAQLEVGSGVGLNVRHSCVTGGYAGDGNMADEPRFRDLVAGDLHLRADSTLRGRGDPAGLPRDFCDVDNDEDWSEYLPLDADRQPRVVGERPDMGAYESTHGTD